MSSLARDLGDGHAESHADPAVRDSYRRIVRACRSAGLSAPDAEDLAQDLWLWLFRSGASAARIASPWLGAAVRNYILRYRRRAHVHQAREGMVLESVPEPQAPQALSSIESNLLLDRVSGRLPERERSLLALIREGLTLSEAARRLGIPRGSRTYCRERIIDTGRRELARRSV